MYVYNFLVIAFILSYYISNVLQRLLLLGGVKGKNGKNCGSRYIGFFDYILVPLLPLRGWFLRNLNFPAGETSRRSLVENERRSRSTSPIFRHLPLSDEISFQESFFSPLRRCRALKRLNFLWKVMRKHRSPRCVVARDRERERDSTQSVPVMKYISDQSA